MLSTTGPRHGWVSDQPVAAPLGRLRCAGFSDRGRTRQTNEDRFRVEERVGLMLVADGMGGHEGGEVAAELAADAIVEYLYEAAAGTDLWPYGFDATMSEDGNRLRTAVHAAHLRLLEASLMDPALAGMGTTVVAAIERDHRLSVAWVGDSRLYLLGEDGLRQVTRDDSWLEAALAENPGADIEELRRHPLRNALTNVLGTNARADVHVIDVALDGHDVIALTTDGVHGALDDRYIAQLLSRRTDPAHAAADLVAAAIGSGSTDNCTAVVARC